MFKVSNGIDIVDVERFRKILYDKDKERFLKKIFTSGEIAYCDAKADSAPYFAARFAAKEAFYKAYPFDKSCFSMKKVEVCKDGNLPFIKTSLPLNNILSLSLSISHEKSFAVASIAILWETRK